MKVYVLMPTVRRDRALYAEARWTAKGYCMAFFQDKGTQAFSSSALTIIDDYLGVWHACNALARTGFEAGADACLFAGDDMDPDPNHTAEEIGRQYLERFPDGYGVMQPCGDPQGIDASGKPAAARICGSAWFGRTWVQESYRGQGPTNGGYYHFYADEELALVAEAQGVMWWRPDLVQYHRHWSFGHVKRQDYHEKAQVHWDADRKLFFERKANGFPRSERLLRYKYIPS